MKKLTIVWVVVFAGFIAAGGAVFARGKTDKGGAGAELALITDSGTINDKSFNQGAWESVVRYAAEHKISHKYYQPAEISDDAYLAAIDLAVRGGAKVVVTPGFLFETAIFIAQDRYADVRFVLIDGSPHSADYAQVKVGANTVGITYAEDQAGFLAGYAAVKDGYRNLGYVGGMAVPSVIRYGYGYVQGAEYAAKELGLASGSVTVNYHYTGGFLPSPEVQAKAASWYNTGVEVIFAAAGGAGNSVFAAAQQANKKAIGVDVDQSGESPAIITSALKGVTVSVYDSIAAFYKGSFPGGQDLVFDAKRNGVGLPLETSKFTRFTANDYNQIFELLANETVPRQFEIPSANGSPSALPLTIVKVIE
ncbi:MAG: BMP family ABC transporter substrate-binding protein [Spirochaetales bacterium]|jgi:basic membrane protein A|nr:BMP family ABC transporter substrate-binding protein [Spirochaetales bacterium]